MFIAFVVILALLTYRELLPISISVTLILITYWLPKCIFVQSLNTFFPEILSNVPLNMPSNSTKNMIALTFDDIPYESDTSSFKKIIGLNDNISYESDTSSFKNIISILDSYNMKGTFFVVSGDVNDVSRKILVDIVKNGHQLGNHGKQNTMHYTLNYNKLKEEIKSCDELIVSIYKEANVKLPNKMLYRPGCGLFHRSMLDLCKQMNYTLTLGSVYPNDPIIRFPLINYYYLKYHIEKNDIVILHDRKWTSLMLTMLLQYMKENNFFSVTVQDLLLQSY